MDWSAALTDLQRIGLAYVLALPIGYWLGLHRGWGLAGIWWALALGVGLVAVSLVVWIRARGPETRKTPEGVRFAAAGRGVAHRA